VGTLPGGWVLDLDTHPEWVHPSGGYKGRKPDHGYPLRTLSVCRSSRCENAPWEAAEDLANQQNNDVRRAESHSDEARQDNC
jgi:hypothetical protein